MCIRVAFLLFVCLPIISFNVKEFELSKNRMLLGCSGSMKLSLNLSSSLIDHTLGKYLLHI